MIQPLADLMRGRKVAVLTGAGCSTESGIPDYRGPTASQRPRTPIQYQDFMRNESARLRYWARSVAGWPRIATALPNHGHHGLANLEAAGAVHGVITQNVDGLHHAAGSKNVVELHGSLAAVRCVTCGDRTRRSDFQDRLLAMNREWATTSRLQDYVSAPDGDAELDAAGLDGFRVPSCSCGGILKPDVVFFGENVAADVVQQAWDILDACEVLLIIGSSLTVYSGRRFVYRAQQESKPIGIINIGPTRADDAATIKIEAPIGEALRALASSVSQLSMMEMRR